MSDYSDTAYSKQARNEDMVYVINVHNYISNFCYSFPFLSYFVFLDF